MNELIAADHDCDMRRVAIGGREEHEIAGQQIFRVDLLTLPKLLTHFPRQGDPILTEDVLSEAAAVEPGRVGAAVAIRCAAQRQRGSYESVAIDSGRKRSNDGCIGNRSGWTIASW